MTTAPPAHHTGIVGGVDAHKDVHHAAALDQQGILLGDRRFPATIDGYHELMAWLSGFGPIDRVGVESTGTYAAGLARHLTSHGVTVTEVNTPHPHTRARKGKDDAIDAEAAARKALSGEAAHPPKDTTGTVESIRVLRVTRSSAVKARSVALTQLQDLLVTAPAELRDTITARSSRGKATQCARLRPDPARLDEPLHAAKYALRSLARRIKNLDEEIAALDTPLQTMVCATAPTLVSLLGVGTVHASQLLITAGQNLERFNSEAAFARMCGVAPIPVSSGRTNRMRLHRGGDRQANRALYMITICRLRYDDRTRTYIQRRTTEGKTKSEAIRCDKRYIAREVYHALRTDLTGA